MTTQPETTWTGLRFLTIKKFSSESGYTPDAIRSKIKTGVWLKDEVWVKAPDGRILIDVMGYEKWVTENLNLGDSNEGICPGQTQYHRDHRGSWGNSARSGW